MTGGVQLPPLLRHAGHNVPFVQNGLGERRQPGMRFSTMEQIPTSPAPPPPPPVISLFIKLRYVREVSSPIALGIGPVSALFAKFRYPSFVNSPIALGIRPVSALLIKLID